MNEHRRCILTWAVLVRGGHVSAAKAVIASELTGRAAGPDPAAATLRPGDGAVVGEVEPLELAMATLERGKQEDVARQVAGLAADAAAARAFVAASGLPPEALHAWDGLAPAAETIAVQPPREPRYTLRREHARGGMGRVLIVADASIGRDVALKETLVPGAPGQGATLGDNERFLREARITGQLEHPNIVPVHEIGHTAEGTPYYTMKFVRGDSMADRLKAIARDVPDEDGRLAKRLQLLDAFVDVCNAVGYAHSRGVINRDLKPANVMLGDYGETFVLDWGLAKIEGQEDRERGTILKQTVARSRVHTPAQGDSSKLTLDGDILGTPSYMAPEQARGEIDAIDRQSDVYSLGAILYEILTGHAPFEGPDLTMVLRSVIALSPVPATKVSPHCPRELAAVAHRALARDKADRLPSARALADEIQAFRDGRRLSVYRYSLAEQVARFARRNRALAGAAALSFAALAVASVVSLRWARVASSESANALRSLEAARKAEAEARSASEEAVRQAHKEQIAREETQRALVVAEGQRLAAVATPIAASNPGQALLLAIEAAKRAPGLAANNAMMLALLRLCEHRRLYEHAMPPDCGAFSASGKFAVTGGQDFVVRVWNLEAGVQIRQFDDHRGAVGSVAFSPDSLLVASGCDDGVVRLWSIDDGTLRCAMDGHKKKVRGVRFVEGGKRVLSWSDDGTARLWTAEGKPAGIFETPGVAVADARAKPDGSRVVTLSGDGTALVWNASDGSRVCALGANVAAIDLSPDGSRVATAGLDGTGDLWALPDGALVRRVLDSPAPLIGALFAPDGKRVAFQVKDSGLRVFDVEGSASALSLSFEGRLFSEALSPDWTLWLDTNAIDPRLRRTGDGSVVAAFQGHDYSLRAHAFSPDGRSVLTVSHDRTCGVWHLEPGSDLAAPPGLDGRRVLALAGSGQRAILADDAGRCRCIDLATGNVEREFEAAPWDVSASGDFAAVAVEPGKLARIIEPATGSTIRELPLPADFRAQHSHFAPDGSALMLDTESRTVQVWEPRTGKKLGEVHYPGVTSLALAPGGRLLAAGNTSHGVISLYDAASGAEVRALRGHTGTIFHVAFSPGGRTLVSSAADASVRLWDVDTGRQLALYRWPRADSLAMSFAPDGRHVSVLGGGFLRILETPALREVFTVTSEFAPAEVAFAPSSDAFFFQGAGGHWRRVPVDLLPLALRAAPRAITPSEMNRFQVGTEAERKAVLDAYQAAHPSVSGDWMTGTQAINAGDFDRAVFLCRRAAAALPHHPDGACYLAEALCARATSRPPGERKADVDEALCQLELAARLGSIEAGWIRTEPAFRVLKDDPRLKPVLEAFEANAKRLE